MTRRIALVFLAISCFSTSFRAAAGPRSPILDDQLTPYSSIAPPFITPAKDVFVVREGDSIVLTVTATCLLEDESETQFELAGSAPGFIHLSAPYRNEQRRTEYAEGLGVALISPQIGDAGKYVVSILVRSCNGKVERVITFKVRVKSALLT
ncbi:MAG: hypothetical protein WAV20_16675 [Blastocatellia bacterium]